MTAGWAAENAEFVLHAQDVDIVDVQEVCGTAIGVDLLFLELEAHAIRILVSFSSIINRAHEAVG
jgi:hypothetical protein